MLIATWKFLALGLILALLLLILLWPSPVQTTEVGKTLANWVASFLTSHTTTKDEVLFELEIWLNVLMFVPFSLTLFLLVPRYRLVVALVSSLCLSVSAELLQKYVLTERVASIQDVTLNLSGAAIGAGLGWLVTLLGTNRRS